MNSLDCIVLAAGNARRMGAWKLMLPWKGMTVVESAVAIALTACSRVLLVTGYRHEELEHIFHGDKRVLCVYNPSWKEGMFSSIKKGVEEVETEAFFVSLADMPGIISDDYQCLVQERLAHLHRGGTEKSVFRPRYRENLGHPVLLCHQAIPLISSLENKFRMKDVLSKLDVHEIESKSPRVVMDVDNAEAYQNILALPEFSEGPINRVKRKFIMITGSIGSGKTSLCQAAYKSLSQNGRSCRGLLQVAGDRAPDGTASEYDALFLGEELEEESTGCRPLARRASLARRAPLELNNIPTEKKIVLGPFVFDGRVFERAEKHLRNKIGTEFYFLDELGKLEMDKGLGLRRSLDYILSLDEFTLIACVRKDKQELMATYASNLGCMVYCIDLDIMRGGLQTALLSLEALIEILN